MKIDSVWAVPIATEHTNFFLTPTEKEDVLKLKKEKAFNIGSISENKKLLDLEKFKRIRAFFFKAAEQYKNEVWCINNPLHLLHSWATFQTKGDYHRSHYHPHAIISMTYYPQCESGELRLSKEKHALQENFEFYYDVSKHNAFNAPCWKIPLKTGTVVIFPGWLRHCTIAHPSITPRICIGANFFIKGKFSKDKYPLNEIDLDIII